MRPSLRVLLALLALGSSVAAAQPAAPDPATRAMARALFEEGVAFVDAADWGAARERFGRALALYDSAVIRFNLARADAELGHVVESAEHLRDVIRRADASAEVREAARELLTTVEPRIARLRVRLEGVADEVRRGETLVPRAALDAPMPVDPGTHELVALRDGEEVGRASITLAEGEAGEVVLRAAEASAEIEPPIILPDPALVTPPPPTPIWAEWWLWTVVGAVVVGVVAGIVLGVTLSDGGCEGPFMPCRIDVP
ncbi:MAG: hypothetical protein KF729_34235 [Sandaracinaceae bacterium]|nr:hypothetical protein [Sandaracinaceae bacterium]